MSSSLALPNHTKALTVQKADSSAKKGLKHVAKLTEIPLHSPKPGYLVVKVGAAAFNHKDSWIRKGMYPSILLGGVYGGDGAGTVVASGTPNDSLLNKRVFFSPIRGWKDHPERPEGRFGILGGVAYPPIGTFSEYVTVEREHVVLSPEHLDDVHVAAWPIAGLTAWRATMINANVQPGHNVLITGIGGGVALFALQLCIAQGANVWVTSGSEEKIRRAVGLGARGGVNYKDDDWPAQLTALLSAHGIGTLFDAVIDSAGGDIMAKVGKVLRMGGRVVCYGMTAEGVIPFTMRQVLANQQLIGSTMGSLSDLNAATAFLSKHKIVPVVSTVLDGLEAASKEGFDIIDEGRHFGKVVIRISKEGETGKARL